MMTSSMARGRVRKCREVPARPSHPSRCWLARLRFVQCFEDHTHEDTHCLRRLNQSFSWVPCVFKINTGRGKKQVKSPVMNVAQERREPCQVMPTAYMVTLHIYAAAANDASRPCNFGRAFH
jgi:hypothetical protein